MFRRIFLDRRILLLIAECLLVVALTRWIIPVQTGFQWVIASGYWFMLAASVIFLAALWPLARGKWRGFRFEGLDRLAFALAFGTVAVWFAQEKPGFKILADEVVLLGTSMGMHYERAAAYPIRATDVQGPFQILQQVLDKRPLLFPFLVTTVHDLTGYRPSNPFYLNMGLAVLFMGLVYLVGWRAGGRRWAGVAAMIFFAGLPLLAQQATGGGFELLNLVLIATVGLTMAWYLEAPDETRLTAMVYAGVLLTSTRYESGIFLLPVAAAALFGWWRAGRVIMSWQAAISPLFLIPLLLQNRLFEGQSGAWELAGVAGAQRPFGFEYVPSNLGHALAFFLLFDQYQPSSPLFAALGLVALPFFGLWIARVFRQPAVHTDNDRAWALLGSGLFSIFGLLMLYFWGKFDDPVIRRLSLPVHLLMVLAIVAMGRKVLSLRGWKALSCLGVIGIVFYSIPVMAKRAYAFSYAPGVEMGLREDFIKTLPEKDYLFIDNDSVFWITHKIPSSPVGSVHLRKDGYAFHLQNHSFSQIYVFQSILVNAANGDRSIDPVDDLGPDFELETVWERKVETLLFARISRVVTIRNEGKEIHPTAAVPLDLQHKSMSKEEQDKNRQLYLENWIKKLP